MYENVTYESILERMLNKVPQNMDKREGSIIYDALAPAAIELQNMYIELDTILNEAFADTASRDYLIRRAAERGIVVKKATSAILKGKFNIPVPVGSRFSVEDLNYIVTAVIDTEACEYKLKCETEGTIGNNITGDMIPIEYIEGLEKAELIEVLIPGEDEEETEDLRKRYFNSLKSEAFGGNVDDYKEKVNNLDGVGGVKIYPVWNGGGTVKLVIIDSSFKVPSTDLVKEVQNEVDPENNQGKGIGFAPIGHTVTVEGVTSVEINIKANVTYQEGWTFEDCKNHIQNAMDKYFIELCKEWENSSNLVVRVSQIETRLLNIEGILDIADTTINGNSKNLELDKDSIPVRGDIIV